MANVAIRQNVFKHVVYRLVILILMTLIVMIFAVVIDDPGIVSYVEIWLLYIYLFSLLLLILWCVYMLIEAFVLHMKKKYNLRNANLVFLVIIAFFLFALFKAAKDIL